MRIVEANVNLRVERGKQPTDYFISKGISENLCGITPQADIIAMVEYMKCKDEEFLEHFSKMGYCLTEALDNTNRGILIGTKGYDIEKICAFSFPHFLHLKLRKETQEIDFIVMRILVGRDVSVAEFKERKAQFLKVLAYIREISTKNMIITGDFNNARIRDNYDGYSQKCYNYQFLIEQFKNIELCLVPIKGYSHRGYLKEDHIILGKSFVVEEVKYDDTLFPYIEDDIIGYPDHVPLVADITLI